MSVSMNNSLSSYSGCKGDQKNDLVDRGKRGQKTFVFLVFVSVFFLKLENSRISINGNESLEKKVR